MLAGAEQNGEAPRRANVSVLAVEYMVFGGLEVWIWLTFVAACMQGGIPEALPSSVKRALG